MTTRWTRLLGMTVLFFGINHIGDAADKPSTSDSTSTPAPTYLTVGDIIGEIVKVDANAITMRVTWYTQAPPKVNPTNGARPNNNNNNNNHHHYGNWHRGTSNRNPQQMHQHMMYMQQQLMRNMVQAQQKAANAKPTEHHQDYVMDFAADAAARIKVLPPKLGENGKKGVYTPEEYQKLKGNPNIPGYKADLSELKTGQLVEAHIVRLPGSEKTADKKDDMIVRWALILNEDHVGKAPAKTDTPKKKN